MQKATVLSLAIHKEEIITGFSDMENRAGFCFWRKILHSGLGRPGCKGPKMLWEDGRGSNTIFIRLHFTFSIYLDLRVRYNY